MHLGPWKKREIDKDILVDKYKKQANNFLLSYKKTASLNKDLKNKLDENCKEVKKLRNENNKLLRKVDELGKYKEKCEEKDNEIKALKEEISRLKAIIDTNSTNSSLPTSKTPINEKKLIPNTRVKTNRKRGGQVGHKKHTLEPFKDDEDFEVIEHTLNTCPNCMSENISVVDVVSKDEIDYKVSIIKQRHKYYSYRCNDCNEEFTIEMPSYLYNDVNYGPNIKAIILSLRDLGFVSVNRTKEIIDSLGGDKLNISCGYIENIERKANKNLSKFKEDVKKELIKANLLYWDDTVIFVNTKRNCYRFYGNNNLALYTSHQTKGLVGIKEDGILTSLNENTTLMHDHNTVNYNKIFNFNNIECIQHLERELYKLYEISKHSWLNNLLKLIRLTIHERKFLKESDINSFGEEKTNNLLITIDDYLLKARQESIKDSSSYYHNDEEALINRLIKYKDNYFAWIKDFSLPTTNNLSERSLRSCKSKQKISGQFGNIDRAKDYAGVKTYEETCKRHGISSYNAFLRLEEGNPYTVEELLSLQST